MLLANKEIPTIAASERRERKSVALVAKLNAAPELLVSSSSRKLPITFIGAEERVLIANALLPASKMKTISETPASHRTASAFGENGLGLLSVVLLSAYIPCKVLREGILVDVPYQSHCHILRIVHKS